MAIRHVARLLGVAITGALVTAAVAAQPIKLLNVSYDPTRELYKEFNAGVRQVLEGEDRTGRRRPAVARRLGQAGPRGDRRPGGRRGHAGPGLRHRRACTRTAGLCRRTGRSGCRTTARPTPPRSSSWSARAIPRSIKDWDDLVKAGRRGHHAQSEDVRRGALELPGGLGLCRCKKNAERRRPRPARDFVSTTVSRTCRCSTPARAARRRPSSSAASATCCWPGRTRRSWSINELGKDKFEIVVPVDQHPGRAAGGRGRQGGRQARHARGGRGLPGVPLLARRGRRSPPSTTTGRGLKAVADKYASGSRRSSCSRSTTCSAAGRRPRRSTSTTAACSTRSCGRTQGRAGRREDAHPYHAETTQRPARLRPDDGLHAAVPEPDRADPAGGAGR